MLSIAREIDIQDNQEIKVPDEKKVTRTGAKPIGSVDLPIWSELARQTYRNRRLRNEIMRSDDLFGEPAWDILLDLFIAAKERRRVSVTSACIGAAVPATTALRWISVLENYGLVQREADSGDARRYYVGLTASRYSKMVEYFSKIGVPAYPVEETVEAADTKKP